MIDGEAHDFDELSLELPDIEACDTLETMHRNITAYDAAVKAGHKNVTEPYTGEAWRWYSGLLRQAYGRTSSPEDDPFFRNAIPVRQAEARLNG